MTDEHNVKINKRPDILSVLLDAEHDVKQGVKKRKKTQHHVQQV